MIRDRSGSRSTGSWRGASGRVPIAAGLCPNPIACRRPGITSGLGGGQADPVVRRGPRSRRPIPDGYQESEVCDERRPPECRRSQSPNGECGQGGERYQRRRKEAEANGERSERHRAAVVLVLPVRIRCVKQVFSGGKLKEDLGGQNPVRDDQHRPNGLIESRTPTL